MKTLITPQQVLALGFADGEYLPPSSITAADIAAAEQRHIVPVVGQAMYSKLLEGSYAAFAAEFLAPVSALFTRLAVQPRLDVRTDRCGTTAPYSQSTRPAGDEALRRLQKGLRAQARTLLHRASEHLEAHRQEFPEYDPLTNILNRCSTDGNIVQRHSGRR